MSDPENTAKLPSWMRDHLRRYLETNGEDGHVVDSPGARGGKATALLLTTIGRRSGKRSQLPLFYDEVNGSYVIVGSKGGAPDHPSWYLNLIANPDVEIQVKDKRMRAKARVAKGEERAALWPKMVAFFSSYADYQAKTQREIPVVVLEPVKN